MLGRGGVEGTKAFEVAGRDQERRDYSDDADRADAGATAWPPRAAAARTRSELRGAENGSFFGLRHERLDVAPLPIDAVAVVVAAVARVSAPSASSD